MRSTIHLVAARDFWPFALGVRRARRQWMTRIAAAPPEAELRRRAADVREALAHGPRTVAELGGMASGFLGNLSLWVDLVRVPPSGTWERRRADRLALAESWLGPEEGTEAEGQVQLVRAYLRAFGPAPWRDISAWSGVPVTALRTAEARLSLVRFRDEDGRELLDLTGEPLPDPDTPAPIRFLPHWDANLLVHTRRAGILPEAARPRVFSSKNPFSVGAVLVDGRTVAAWSLREGRVVLDPFEEIPARARDDVEAERAALEAFHA
jgi:hypothetical protein